MPIHYLPPRASQCLTQLGGLHRGHGETPDSMVVKPRQRCTYMLAAWDSLPVNHVISRRNRGFRLREKRLRASGVVEGETWGI